MNILVCSTKRFPSVKAINAPKQVQSLKTDLEI